MIGVPIPTTASRTITKTLVDLLREWARLEPGRCRCAERAFEVRLGPHWYLACSRENAVSDLSRGVLQAALYDALAEHGLDWTLSSHGGGFSATVVRESAVSYEITTYSEGMSLLWAYLEALSPLPCGLDA